jgi:NAD(P)-dependent dehydrogenase (short-subunit alcohol dehydrogenase family)
MSAYRRVALVTGGNRGIGLEVTRGLVRRGMSVVAGARDLERGEEAVGPLREEGLDVEVRRLDVTDAASVAAVMEELERERGRLDVLVNNAGVLAGEAALKVPLDVAEEMLRVNALGPWRVCQAAAPLMRRAGYGRIVNVSSGAGSLAGMGTYAPPYSVS